MRAYELELPLRLRVLPFLVLGVFTFVAPVFLIREAGPAIGVAVVWLGVVAWQWWMVLSIVHRMVIHDDGALECISLARRVSIRPETIQEIAPDRRGSIGFFRLRHAGGSVRFINQVTGFHEIVLHVKMHSPGVILKGC